MPLYLKMLTVRAATSRIVIEEIADSKSRVRERDVDVIDELWVPAGLGELRVLHLLELEIGRRWVGLSQRTGPPRSRPQYQSPKAITLPLFSSP
jgi:hypothetical protein